MKALAPTAPGTSLRIRIRFSLIVALLCALTPLATPRTVEAQVASTRIETFSLAPEGEVRVENPRGATSIEAWNDQSVRVIAEKRAPARGPLAPSELLMMGAQNTLFIQCRQTGGIGRIDLKIYVPRGARVQVTGGAWPVDVSGSLSSAVIESTSGNIAYRLPQNDDARVVMHSARGVVRSTVALTGTERVGTQSLQGQLGAGSAPIVLSSTSGNISLGPAPAESSIARALEEARTAAGGGSRVAGQGRVADSPAYQAGSAAGSRQPDYDQDVGRSAPRGGGSAGSSQSGGGWVQMTQEDRSDDETTTNHGGGPFMRPRRETRTSNGGAGFRVRIIPSNQTADKVREPEDMVYDPFGNGASQPADPDADAGAPGGSYPRASQPAGSRRQNDRSASRPVYNTPDQSVGRRPLPDAPGEDEEVAPQTASAGRRPDARPVLRRNDADRGSADGSPVERAAPVEAAEKGGREKEGGKKEPEEEAIVLNSSLVSLNVSVTDRSGMALPNLNKEEFEVHENGERQAVEFFQSATSPFNLVLLLDLSGSIQDKLDVVKTAALRFLEVIGPNDKVAVLAFTHDVSLVSPLTSDRDLLRKRIKAIKKPEGGTAFYEAMWFALADTLKGTRGQRNAIVVMTDGVDSSLDRYNPAPTRVTFSQLARRLEESDVIVFPIYLDTEYEEVFERGNSTSEVYSIARDQLDRLSELTGGQRFLAQRVNDLSGVYKQVAAALRTVYSVGYYPTNPDRDGTFRRVRVGVNRPGAAVKTRKGYYAK